MRSLDSFLPNNRWIFPGALVLLVFALLGSGCGRWTIKDRMDPPPKAAEVEGIRRVGLDPPMDYAYRIGPGDSLMIRFFYYPEMLEPAIVIPSTGIVQMPLIGGLQMIGYTEEELNSLLKEKYAGYLMFPDVTARITVQNHDMVRMDGVAAAAPAMAYSNNLTLLGSLQKVAMGRDVGALRSVIVIRGLNTPEYRAFRVDANKIVQGKEPDIYLEPNDIVYVPKKFIEDVNYFVYNYIDQVLGQHIMPATVFPQAFPYTGQWDYDVNIEATP